MTKKGNFHCGLFRKGDGRPRGHTARPPEDRFWEKVDRRGPDECWPWIGGTTHAGYGQFHLGPKDHFQHIYAHRFSYELLVGPIPEGMTIDHVKARGCLMRRCVNPAHLEPVTNKINSLRGTGVAALNARKTCCPKGHPYDESNTYVYPGTGRRKCRICLKAGLLISQRKVRAKKRLQRTAA